MKLFFTIATYKNKINFSFERPLDNLKGFTWSERYKLNTEWQLCAFEFAVCNHLSKWSPLYSKGML